MNLKAHFRSDKLRLGRVTDANSVPQMQSKRAALASAILAVDLGIV